MYIYMIIYNMIYIYITDLYPDEFLSPSPSLTLPENFSNVPHT